MIDDILFICFNINNEIIIIIHCYIKQKMPQRRRSQHDSEGEEKEQNQSSMQQFIDLLVRALQERPVNLPVTPITTFKDFKNAEPPEFKGTTEPIEPQAQIKKIEKAFMIARVDQKTVFATYMMKGEANFWWEANQHRA